MDGDAAEIRELPATSHEEASRRVFRRAYPGELAVLECAWSGAQPAAVLRFVAGEHRVDILRNAGGDLYLVSTGAAAGPDEVPPAIGRVLRDTIVRPGAPRWQVFIPSDQAWADWLTATFGGLVEPQSRRYFDGDPAASGTTEPAGTRVIDEAVAARARDLFGDEIFAAWGDIDRFLASGFGTVALHPEDPQQPVSVCLSYSVGGGAAEIDIVTAKAHRRQGHGLRAARAFLHQCARRGLRPSWSCHESNRASKVLAERLGFRPADLYWWMPVQSLERGATSDSAS